MVVTSVIFGFLIQTLLSLFLIWPRYLVLCLLGTPINGSLCFDTIHLIILLSFYYVHSFVYLLIFNNFSIYVVVSFTLYYVCVFYPFLLDLG